MDLEKEAFLDAKIANMSLEELIGQLIYIDFRNTAEMTDLFCLKVTLVILTTPKS